MGKAFNGSDLANTINKAFLSPMSTLRPLNLTTSNLSNRNNSYLPQPLKSPPIQFS